MLAEHHESDATSLFWYAQRRRVELALDALREGRGVMVLDEVNRENEGDMIFPRRTMTNRRTED